MTAEENWDEPVQKAIREYDAKLGHQPYKVQFPPPLDDKPNGGATVYVRPGNPYARIDEDSQARPVVEVELPAYEEPA